MLQVAAYCRVSTDKEDQANSFEAQQRYFREYIQRQPDWELQGIYADEGFSGTSTNKRVEFNKMLHAAELGQIDLIVTKEVSRFTRNTVDALQITRELRRRGVGVLFLNDSLDTRTNDGELRLTIMSSFAQDESRRTSERSKWGQMRSMEKGVVFGGSLLGYDVIGGKMTVNPEGAEVVRLIFHKYLQERKGCSTIARELREAGILSSKGNCLWSSATVTKILKNEKYCGDLIQKKTYTPDYLTHEKKYNHGKEPLVELKDHHEPIVSRELFEKANRILDEKSLTQEGKAKHSNRYPFSGKIKCGCCGSSYVARYKNRNNGTRYKAWRCYKSATQGSPHTDKAGNPLGCSNPSIRNEDAVHIMYLVTRSLQLEEKKITANLLSVIQSVLSVNINYSHIEKLKEQIQSVEDKRTQLIDLCISGAITKQEFITKREVCDKEISELQDTISGIDQQHLLADQQESVMKEITAAIHEIVSGVEYEDAFYSQILDKMVVQSKDTVDVYLNLLPIKWSYAVAKASKGVLDPKSGISETEIPISVNIARSSG